MYTFANDNGDRNGMVLTDTQAAVDYLYANGLTKFSTTTSFMADSNLRRDEAAAFFARFARDVLDMVPDTSKAECSTFTDLSLAHSDLKSEIVASCQLGLFKGSNGKFMPTASFSNAHALTVIVRLLDGDQSETGAHRASNYLKRAQTLGLTSGLSADSSNKLDSYISRGDVARLIEAGSVQGKTDHDYTQRGDDQSVWYIEGAFNYPSSYIPSDMTACAQDVNTQQVFCSNTHIQGTQYQFWEGFKIEVPAGDYQVYQYVASFWTWNLIWYYSEMVPCWLMNWCPQGLLTVSVSAWATVSNINPRDRYQ
jgi:hypothetical protein